VVALFLLILATLSGCGQSQSGTVTGKVTFNGEPVGAGTVAFYGTGDKAAIAALRPDGTYEAVGVPLGEVKVTVTTPPPPPAPEVAANNPMMRKKKVTVPTAKGTSLPPKYASATTSQLTLTVTEGTQTFNIPLP
jgi:hypothetical protein